MQKMKNLKKKIPYKKKTPINLIQVYHATIVGGMNYSSTFQHSANRIL